MAPLPPAHPILRQQDMPPTTRGQAGPNPKPKATTPLFINTAHFDVLLCHHHHRVMPLRHEARPGRQACGPPPAPPRRLLHHCIIALSHLWLCHHHPRGRPASAGRSVPAGAQAARHSSMAPRHGLITIRSCVIKITAITSCLMRSERVGRSVPTSSLRRGLVICQSVIPSIIIASGLMIIMITWS